MVLLVLFIEPLRHADFTTDARYKAQLVQLLCDVRLLPIRSRTATSCPTAPLVFAFSLLLFFKLRQALVRNVGVGRVFSLFSLFRLQRLPLAGRPAVTYRVALTYSATIIVGLAAHQAGRPDLIRSPKRVLAHPWEGLVE